MAPKREVMEIRECPREKAFTDANTDQAPVKMRVRDERGRESEIVFSLLGYTQTEGFDAERRLVKTYQFQGTTASGDDLSGEVTPEAKDRKYGQIIVFRRDEKQVSAA